MLYKDVLSTSFEDQMRPHKHSAVYITMKSLMLSFQWFPIILLIFSGSVTATWINIPRLSPFRQTNLKQPETMKASLSKDLQTFYYTQTLDHFNYRPESYTTFQQRYYINFKNWGGANVSAPIVAYLGAESPLGVNEIALAGFLTDNANRFNALLVYIEHRYYGKSIPFGSRKEALRNASTLGYFNSAQAIADYASILLHIKKKLHARYSPVIVIGGSYGGMLATWLRLKYPHVALGALASSAPILYFDDITPQDGYFSVVTKDFREVSENCYQTILKSWSEIDRIASKPNGLSILSKRFKTCYPLEKASDLKGYLVNIYIDSAQYDQPPEYPVTKICGAIDGASSGMDILSKISAGVIAYMKNMSCYFINHELGDPSETAEGWQWQTCSEIVIPLGGKKASGAMFQTAPFNLSHVINRCKSLYGVQPRPHWVTTNYGGHDIKLILQRFASNIIFSNGLRDPYSSGGVLEDISDSVLAITTVNGSHCLDLHHAKQTDPQWLVRQRNIEVEIIEGWITKYYADLHALKQ